MCVFFLEEKTSNEGGKQILYSAENTLNHRIQFLLKNGTRSKRLRSLMLP